MCMCARVHVCMCVGVYVCMYVCMCVCMCGCVYGGDTQDMVEIHTKRGGGSSL